MSKTFADKLTRTKYSRKNYEKGRFAKRQYTNEQLENLPNIEKIYNNGMDKFLTYYRDIKFKCVDVQYHDKTQKIKYMLFEQITQ